MAASLSLFPTQEQTNQHLVMVSNDRVVTTSLQVAEYFGKPHYDVLKSIKSLDCSDLFRDGNFSLSCYTKKNGNITKSYPMYYMTRDGFTLLAMGFTGKKTSFISCALRKMMYFCSATTTYISIAKAICWNERRYCVSHSPFIYSSNICGCSKLGLCGDVFLFHHLTLQPDENI